MIKDLCFITPEEAGLSANNIVEFIDSVKERKINLHSFMLVRDGKIFTEAYYKPIDKQFCHRLYSASKSYVSLAVGLLVTEGKVSVQDKILTYFPQYAQADDPYGWLRDLTIEHLLMMTFPGTGDDYWRKATCTPAMRPCALLPNDWTKEFFGNRQRWEKPNGTLWSYHSAATNVLNELVERLTGKDFLTYLRPVFDKIGVSKKIKCVQTPDGFSWGGSGVICSLRDFAKVGEFLLNKGNVNGEQLIDREYMEKATSKMVDIIFDGYQHHCVGYGYQIWVHPYGYGMRGMGSELVYCFPDKNFLFVCQADTYAPNNSYEFMLYHELVDKLYKPMGDKLPENKQANEYLQEKLNNSSLLCGYGKATSPYMQKVDGQTYELSNNAMGIRWIRLHFEKSSGVFVYENERGQKEIPFGLERFVEFDFPETHYYDMQVCKEGNRKLHAVACGSWTMEHRLMIRVNVIDNSIGNVGMVFEFYENSVAVRFQKWAEAYLGEYEGFAVGRKK